MASVFEYSDLIGSARESGEFVLQIPQNVRSKNDLLLAFYTLGKFPGYFGDNWDALLDCLRDLNWISSRIVTIAHNDIPLRDNESECRTYLEILQEAIVDWSSAPKRGEIEDLPGSVYVDHELRVIFPTEARAPVERLLSEVT